MAKIKGVYGLGDIVDKNWNPILKTVDSWKKYAEKLAKKRSKEDHYAWHGVVAHNSGMGYCRISMAAQKVTN